MAKVILTGTMAGPDGVFYPGHVLETDAITASHLVKQRMAIPYVDPNDKPSIKPENTSLDISTREKAVTPISKARPTKK